MEQPVDVAETSFGPDDEMGYAPLELPRWIVLLEDVIFLPKPEDVFVELWQRELLVFGIMLGHKGAFCFHCDFASNPDWFAAQLPIGKKLRIPSKTRFEKEWQS